MIKKQYDQIGGLAWILLGSALSISSIGVDLGGFHRPGPGLVAFLTGNLLTVLGFLLVMFRTLGKKRHDIGEKISIIKFWEKGIYLIIASFAYVFLLDPLGFIIATLLLFLFLLKIAGTRNWVVPILISFLSVALSYLIFDVWLRINFPRGIFR